MTHGFFRIYGDDWDGFSMAFTGFFSGDRKNDLTDQCSPILVEALQVNLVGGIPTPLKNDGVKVGLLFPIYGKINMFKPPSRNFVHVQMTPCCWSNDAQPLVKLPFLLIETYSC